MNNLYNMNILDKHKKLLKITSKSTIKPVLQCVLSKGDVLVATDSFRLVELRQEPKQLADGLYMKNGELSGEAIDQFPDYTQIVPHADRKPDVSIKLNRKYLIECLDALGKGDAWDTVKMDLYTDTAGRPIIFTNDKGRAFIMPLNR